MSFSASGYYRENKRHRRKSSQSDRKDVRSVDVPTIWLEPERRERNELPRQVSFMPDPYLSDRYGSFEEPEIDVVMPADCKLGVRYSDTVTRPSYRVTAKAVDVTVPPEGFHVGEIFREVQESREPKTFERVTNVNAAMDDNFGYLSRRAAQRDNGERMVRLGADPYYSPRHAIIEERRPPWNRHRPAAEVQTVWPGSPIPIIRERRPSWSPHDPMPQERQQPMNYAARAIIEERRPSPPPYMTTPKAAPRIARVLFECSFDKKPKSRRRRSSSWMQ